MAVCETAPQTALKTIAQLLRAVKLLKWATTAKTAPAAMAR
jgi:hypothetical protein